MGAKENFINALMARTGVRAASSAKLVTERKAAQQRLKEERGRACEDYIFNALSTANVPDSSVVLRNAYLPYKDSTAELDIILVTNRGLFCIECKAIQGEVHGMASKLKWYTYQNGSRFKFYNPIWQNARHLKALQLAVGDIPMISYVCFYDNADLSQVVNNSPACVVTTYTDIVEAIEQHIDKLPVALSIDELRQCISTLRLYVDVSEEVKQRHLESIVGTPLTCPWCGGRLQKRYGYSWFYGCSNYPTCKYIRSCDEED